jgi:hypothetical protein
VTTRERRVVPAPVYHLLGSYTRRAPLARCSIRIEAARW